ncbi:hypothetical protein pb186bvf_005919 [Paramecium bursaria]
MIRIRQQLSWQSEGLQCFIVIPRLQKYMILCQIFYISKWIQQFKTKIVKINMITQILGFIYNRLMNNNSIIQLIEVQLIYFQQSKYSETVKIAQWQSSPP